MNKIEEILLAIRQQRIHGGNPNAIIMSNKLYKELEEEYKASFGVMTEDSKVLELAGYKIIRSDDLEGFLFGVDVYGRRGM